MVHDSLNLFTPRSRFTAIGTFWTSRPDSADMGGIKFTYEYVDTSTRAYRRLFSNMQSFEAGEVAIRTNDLLPWDAKCYFMTADGQLYRILQVQKDFSVAPKQALRMLSTPLGTEYVIRAVNVENPWGAK